MLYSTARILSHIDTPAFIIRGNRPVKNSRMFALTAYRPDQPKTFQFQKTLPRLPIPTLSNSIDKYLRSLRPLLLQKALKEGKGEDAVEAELKKREEWAKDFTKQGGLGVTLQERLKG